MNAEFDAIVVGGGLAGVTAAREMEHRGLRTVLLEARSRLGGRAWTTEFGGGSIEMGGQNVYWTEPFLWTEISRYRLDIAEVVPFQTYAIAEGDGFRRLPASEAGKQLGQGFDAFFGEYGEYLPRPYDPSYDARLAELDRLSIQDRLDQLDLPAEVNQWLLPWLAMRTGGSLDAGAFTWLLHIYALSDWSWQEILLRSSRYRLRSGTKSLIDAIFADSGAQLRLDSPVERIDDDDTSVTVTTESGDEYRGRVAVIATSANMWATMKFSQALSEAKLGSSRTGMQTPNAFIKLWALVRGEVENVYVQRQNYRDHPIIHLRKDMPRADGLTQVIAFSVDPTVDPNDHEHIAELFRETLPMPNAEIVEVTAQNWVADPFTRGGTSLLRPGQLSMLEEIRRPEGLLAFCTADIASGIPGFDGAIQTGVMAGADAVAIARGRKGGQTEPGTETPGARRLARTSG